MKIDIKAESIINPMNNLAMIRGIICEKGSLVTVVSTSMTLPDSSDVVFVTFVTPPNSIFNSSIKSFNLYISKIFFFVKFYYIYRKLFITLS